MEHREAISVDTPTTFFDAYVLHLRNRLKTKFICSSDGLIKFLDYDLVKREDLLCIHVVEVNKSLIRTGIFTRFITKIVNEHEDTKEIVICGVGSYDMISCIKRLETLYKISFVDHGGDYIWSRPV